MQTQQTDELQELRDKIDETAAELHEAQERLYELECAYEEAGGKPYRHQPPDELHYIQPTYVPAKDHMAAGLLAIVLGCFGIHKFYLGYTTPGFVMLAVTIIGGVLTFGIAAAVMMVVGIAEGVIYIKMSQSEFEDTHVNHVRNWF